MGKFSRTRRNALLCGSALAVVTFGVSEAQAQCSSFAAGSLAAVANATISVIGTANTAFLAQGTAFVGSPNSPQPDQTGGGTWIRGIGGEITTKSSGPLTGSFLCNQGTQQTTVRQEFAGVQVGQDLGKLNIGNSGANVHYGITAGYIESNARDRSGGDFSGKFQVPFVGVYSTFTRGNFFADAQTRLDFYHATLTSPAAGFFGQGADARGISFASSAGYKFDFPNGNGWFIEPSVGIIHSIVQVDPINSAGSVAAQGGFAKVNDIESTLGRAGVRVGTSFVSGNFALQPFATVSVWHEFEKSVNSEFCLAPCDTIPPVVAQLSSSRVGTYGQYSAGIAGQMLNTGWLGYVRVDYRNGANIEGLSVNGGLRYQLQPGVAAAAAGPRMVTKAPVALVDAPYNWSGFYLGAFIGTQWGETRWLFPAFQSATFPRLQGLLGGGAVGYNFQAGSWVIGVEADIAASNARGSKACPDFGFPGLSFLLTCNNDRVSPLGTVTGRLGYAWDNVLMYVKGGGAWAKEEYSITCNDPALCAGATTFSRASDNSDGWIVGVGMEFGLSPNWSGKVEYNHIDFGTAHLTDTIGLRVDIRKTVDVVKIGVNYRFGQTAAATDSPLRAMAADFPAKAPSAPLAPAYNWIGCYAGIQGGGAWGRSRVDTTGAFVAVIPYQTVTGDFNVSGALIGGTLGCNLLEARNWVFGAESDLSWSSKKGSQNTIAANMDTAVINEVRENWLLTTRGRVGYAASHAWLLFATAGLAVAEIKYTASGGAPPIVGGSVSESHTRSGWTVGAGAEWKFAPNWSLKAEYLYVDFGGTAYFEPLPPGLQNNFANRSGGVFLNDHIIRGGINYRFDWSMLGARS